MPETTFGLVVGENEGMKQKPNVGPVEAFEVMYAAARRGDGRIPWDRDEPSSLLKDWVHNADVGGRRTLVVGCGYGRDAEYLARAGAKVTAFDVSPTAISDARQRHASSAVHYVVADLLAPPRAWRHAFELVVEDVTVQAVPDPVRADMIASISSFVAPGGTLLVLAAAGGDTQPGRPGPPWPLSRLEIDAFTADGLSPVAVEQHEDNAQRYTTRWRAHFTRPAVS